MNKRLFLIAFRPLTLAAIAALAACSGAGNTSPLPDQGTAIQDNGSHFGSNVPAPTDASTPAPTDASTPAPTDASATLSTTTMSTATTTCTTNCVTPLAATAFNDSIGVNTHLVYSGTAWDSGYATYSSTLMNSPIKHIRDSFCNWGTASGFCTGNWKTRWNQLASYGKKFDVITNPWMGWTSTTTGCHGTCLSGYPTALGLASGSVEAYEGPNECDDHGGNCTDWGTRSTTETTQYVVSHWTPLVAALRSSSVAVYGPAMAFASSYLNYSNESSYLNYGAVHNYTKPLQPETTSTCCSYSIWNTDAAHVSGSSPLVTTESGYNTDPSGTNGGITQLAQERYTPRMLFWQLEHGIAHTYLYELFDYPAGSGTGQDFGLLNGNFTPKPAWTTLMQIMTFFKDTGVSPRTPVSLTLSGDTTGTLQKVLFQRSNANYVFVPWLAKPISTANNSGGNTNIAPVTETLKLTLPSTVTSISLTKFSDNGSAQTTSTIYRNSAGAFSLPVSSVVEAVSFHT